MEKLSEYLKAQRETKGIRLEEIASITKINLHSLELMEQGSWLKLPPEPFIRGFLSAYAKYVGLETRDVVARYQAELHPDQVPSDTALSAAPPATVEAPGTTPSDVIEQSQAPVGRHLIWGGAAVAAALMIGFVTYVGMRNPVDRTVEAPIDPATALATLGTTPVPEPSHSNVGETIASTLGPRAESAPVPPPILAEVPILEVPATPVVPEKAAELKTPAPVATLSPVARPPELVAEPQVAAKPVKAHEISIHAKHRTWIKVVTDDAPPLETFLAEDETRSFGAEKKIKIVLGNSSGALITHNSEPTEGVKFNGTIRSYIFPPEARFPQDVPAKRSVAESKKEKPEDPNADPTESDTP